MKIISFQNKYRDDMIFMYLTAKNALGRIPKLKDDLLDVENSYFNNGGKFWLAIDDNDRVIGCIGILPKTEEQAEVKRLFVMPNLKRQGIGSRLLETLEQYAKKHSFSTLYLHLGNIKYYYESRCFYKNKGYVEYKPDYMKKNLIN